VDDFYRAEFSRARNFPYLPDEPGRSEYAYIRKLADTFIPIQAGKGLRAFVTKRYVKSWMVSIDIWDTGPLGYDIERATLSVQRVVVTDI